VEQKKPFLKKFSVLFATLVGIFLIAYLLPFGEILKALKEVSLKSLAIGLSLYTLSYLFRTFRWKYYYPKAPLGYLFFTTSANTFFNNLLPARMGEGSIFLLLKRFDPSVKETLKKFLKVRLLDGFAILTLLTLSVAWVKVNPFLGVVISLSVYPLGVFISKFLSRFHSKIPSLRWEVAPFLLSVGALISKLLAVYTVLEFLKMDFFKFAGGFIGGELSSILPIHSFAGLGSYETAFAFSLKLLFGETFKEGFKVAFLSHSFLLFGSSLLGLLSLLFLKRKG